MNDEEHPLTVAELIAKLQQFDPNLPVFTEGCDCYGDARDVEVDSSGDVIITRTK